MHTQPRNNGTTDATRSNSGRYLTAFMSLQRFLYPPEKDNGYPGYGQTFSERFPSIQPHSADNIYAGKAAMVIIALITGIATGTAASLLKLCIASISRWLTALFDPGSMNLGLILLPLAGILLTGIYQRYVLHREIYHGVDRLSNDFRHNRCYLPVALTYSPLVAASVTLGFGGSAGSEGPIAYSGAAMGSNIASWFRLSPRDVRVMTAIGAGAGIAGIFKAPLGGALFTIEVLGISMSAISVISLIAACVISAITAYVLSGCTPDIPFHITAEISYGIFPPVLLFGIICGIYSAYYSKIMVTLKRFFSRIRNPWIKNSIAGLIIGILIFLFPPLYGEGYGFVAQLLDGDYTALTDGGVLSATFLSSTASVPALLMLAALGMLACKAVATSSTNSGGGVAGDFAPTIMIGGVAGFLFAYAAGAIFGITLPVRAYVFMGMAGVLSGAIRAPLMAMFLITEMATSGYGQFMPVAVVATVSYLVVCLIRLIGRKTRQGSISGG